jgi:hypothetical protein
MIDLFSTTNEYRSNADIPSPPLAAENRNLHSLIPESFASPSVSSGKEAEPGSFVEEREMLSRTYTLSRNVKPARDKRRAAAV